MDRPAFPNTMSSVTDINAEDRVIIDLLLLMELEAKLERELLKKTAQQPSSLKVPLPPCKTDGSPRSDSALHCEATAASTNIGAHSPTKRPLRTHKQTPAPRHQAPLMPPPTSSNHNCATLMRLLGDAPCHGLAQSRKLRTPADNLSASSPRSYHLPLHGTLPPFQGAPQNALPPPTPTMSNFAVHSSPLVASTTSTSQATEFARIAQEHTYSHSLQSQHSNPKEQSAIVQQQQSWYALDMSPESQPFSSAQSDSQLLLFPGSPGQYMNPPPSPLPKCTTFRREGHVQRAPQRSSPSKLPRKMGVKATMKSRLPNGPPRRSFALSQCISQSHQPERSSGLVRMGPQSSSAKVAQPARVDTPFPSTANWHNQQPPRVAASFAAHILPESQSQPWMISPQRQPQPPQGPFETQSTVTARPLRHGNLLLSPNVALGNASLTLSPVDNGPRASMLPSVGPITPTRSYGLAQGIQYFASHHQPVPLQVGAFPVASPHTGYGSRLVRSMEPSQMGEAAQNCTGAQGQEQVVNGESSSGMEPNPASEEESIGECALCHRMLFTWCFGTISVEQCAHHTCAHCVVQVAGRYVIHSCWICQSLIMNQCT